MVEVVEHMNSQEFVPNLDIMVDLLVVDLVTNHQDNQEEVLHNQVLL
jgi:hypothetical protein